MVRNLGDSEWKLIYTSDVTAGEMWRAVGKLLTDARESKDWKWSDVEKHGGPSYHVIKDQERGHPKSVSGLERHAKALGLSIVDVLAAVLIQAASPISLEAAAILRAYEQSPVAGRQALVQTARALEELARLTKGRLPDGPRQ
jgi:hypothetical protein